MRIHMIYMRINAEIYVFSDDITNLCILYTEFSVLLAECIYVTVHKLF